jgi:hypothetical protein
MTQPVRIRLPTLASWSEWPSRAIRRVLSERVAFGILPAALFALLPSSSSLGNNPQDASLKRLL